MKNFKSILAIVIAAMTFGACSNDLESEYTNNAVKLRSQEEAIAIAQNAYSEFGVKDSRGKNKVAIAKNGVKIVKKRSSRGTANDTLMYVVNFEDSLGFALVSANTSSLPLIGIAERGNYDPEIPTEDESFNFFMECANAYLENSNSANEEVISDTNYPLVPILPFEIAPKIPVLWGQSYPYGNAVPYNIAGCANTTTAQIMAYFRKPETITLTFLNNISPSTLNLDWDLMIQHKQTPNQCDEVELHTAHYMLRMLHAQLYKENNSHPHETDLGIVTGTKRDSCYNSLINHGYTCTTPLPFANVHYKNYLSNNYVMYVIGLSSGNTDGHAWIMDGYKSIGITTYCHYNWGWDGYYNGYFASNVFDTSSGYSYDELNGNASNNTSGTTHNYNSSVTLSAVTY